MRFARLVAIICFFTGCAVAQQPQTSDVSNTQPLDLRNVKYVQGVGPGYWPTCTNAGATSNCPGLTLYLTAGTSWCQGTIQTYAGATLTMTASATNYVYLDPAASCTPAFGTSTFTATQMPIAKVVTSGSAITAITDYRNPFHSLTLSSLPGTLGCPQLPTFTGDVTNSLCAMTAVGLHLSPTPTLCSSGNYARGIDANGNATGCTTASGGGTTGGGPAVGAYYCSDNSNLLSCASRFSVVANQIILATCEYYTAGAGAGTPSFSDTLSLTWHQIATVFQPTGSYGVTAWWANPGSTTGADNFNCGNTVGMSFGGLTVWLITGATLAGPIDTSATTSGGNVNINLALTTSLSSDLLFFVAEYGSSITTVPGGNATPLTAPWLALYWDTGAATAVWSRQAGNSGPYYINEQMNGNFAAMIVAMK